jgi:hypothetical protein
MIPKSLKSVHPSLSYNLLKKVHSLAQTRIAFSLKRGELECAMCPLDAYSFSAADCEFLLPYLLLSLIKEPSAAADWLRRGRSRYRIFSFHFNQRNILCRLSFDFCLRPSNEHSCIF